MARLARNPGLLIAVLSLHAAASASTSPSNHDTKELSSLVETIMLSDKMTGVLAALCRREADTAVATALAAYRREAPGSIMARQLQVAETSPVVCELANCGSSDSCAALNKVLDDIARHDSA